MTATPSACSEPGLHPDVAGHIAAHGLELRNYMDLWCRQHEEILSQYVGHGTGIPRADRRPSVQVNGVAKHGSLRPAARKPDGDDMFAIPATFHLSPGSTSEEGALEGNVPGVPARPSMMRHSRTKDSMSSMQDSGLKVESIRRAVAHWMTKHLPRTFSSSEYGVLKELVESWRFEMMCSFIIIGNAVFISVAADYGIARVQAGERPSNAYIDGIEFFFTAWYLLELVLKVVAWRSAFFCGYDWRWNAFDSFVVATGLYDSMVSVYAEAIDHRMNIAFLRVLRVVRMVKMMRVVRVLRVFKELRMVIGSVLGSFKAMFWSLVLLFVVLYMCGVSFLQAATQHIADHYDAESNQKLLKYWGSTGTAMNSLFMAVTGGENWWIIAEPLWKVGFVFYWAFVIYVCFFMFVIVNTLTGLFVEASLVNAEKDNNIMISEELKKKEHYVDRIASLYYCMDQSRMGGISREDFLTGLDSPQMLAFASSLGIEVADVDEFFRLLSSDGKEPVSFETFVVGCMKLRGYAKSIDLISLENTTRKMKYDFREFTRNCQRQLNEMSSLLSGARVTAGKPGIVGRKSVASSNDDSPRSPRSPGPRRPSRTVSFFQDDITPEQIAQERCAPSTIRESSEDTTNGSVPEGKSGGAVELRADTVQVDRSMTGVASLKSL